jgi:hypothetical protein
MILIPARGQSHPSSIGVILHAVYRYACLVISAWTLYKSLLYMPRRASITNTAHPTQMCRCIRLDCSIRRVTPRLLTYFEGDKQEARSRSRSSQTQFEVEKILGHQIPLLSPKMCPYTTEVRSLRRLDSQLFGRDLPSLRFPFRQLRTATATLQYQNGPARVLLDI